MCVLASDNSNDACGTAYESGVARKEDYCARSEDNCAICKGKWCGKSESQDVSKNKLSAKADARGRPGFCCYSGAASSKTDMCGSCYPTARALEGSVCDAEEECGGCGGVWCMSSCVMSFADASQPCSTAYESGIAASNSYCAQSEVKCSTCKGIWCLASSVKLAGIGSTTNTKVSDNDNEDSDESAPSNESKDLQADEVEPTGNFDKIVANTDE